MFSQFDEIQQRAEKLNTNIRLGDVSEFRVPSITATTASVSGSGLSRLDAGLDDIFRRSEEIWNQKQSIRPVTGMGASLRANKDLSQLNTTRLSTAAQAEKPEPMGYKGVNKEIEEGQFHDEEVGKYVQRAFERIQADRARIDAERAFLNQQILEKSQASSTLFSPKRPQGGGEAPQKMDKIIGKGMKHFVNLPSSPLAHEQNIFAQKIDTSLMADCNALLISAIREALKKLSSKEADYIWSKVFTIFPKTAMLKSGETVREMRSTKRWLEHIIEKGTQFLQKELEEHMEATIEANRVRARRGGIPGTLSRVEAYLNVKQPAHPIFEDGLYDSHPKWRVLFYCLRVGDLLAASKIAQDLFNNAQCSTLVSILANLPKIAETNIDDEKRAKLRAEWKQNASGCQDIHKRAVYGLFLGFECPEANQTIEDWLWARIFACKYAQEPTRALRQLQTTICVQHGEKYFVGEGGSNLIYFTVLILTGQIERAIHVLFRSANDRVHSVHIALLANQLQLLLCTQKVSDEILIPDVHEASICNLNLARLVLLYVKDFELTNVNFALNYCFFLRDFELDPSAENKVGRSVFETCVSRIVFLSGERDAILGQLNQQGERVPGLIYKFSGALNISDVIGRVALDTNIQGDPLGACHLYALADRSKEAMKLICCQLSHCISNSSSQPTLKAVECANWLAQRYKQRQPNVQEDISPQFTTLLMLLELHTFFTLSTEGRHQQAVEVIQKLRFIPTDPEDVQASVAQFHLVPEEVRPLLPEICAQLMRSIVSLHQAAPASSAAIMMLKQFAKAVTFYTAMIPYRFPVSTNSLILQLQSKIV